MEQTPEQTNQLHQPVETAPQQESIFDEAEILGTDYDKHIKKARNALFIIAGLEVVAGIFSAAQANHVEPTYLWGEVFFIAAIFVGLGFWSKSKPLAAITTGLVIFILYQLLYAFIDPVNIIRGILIKIAIVVYLITGIRNAQEAKRIKDALDSK